MGDGHIGLICALLAACVLDLHPAPPSCSPSPISSSSPSSSFQGDFVRALLDAAQQELDKPAREVSQYTLQVRGCLQVWQELS